MHAFLQACEDDSDDSDDRVKSFVDSEILYYVQAHSSSASDLLIEQVEWTPFNEQLNIGLTKPKTNLKNLLHFGNLPIS